MIARLIVTAAALALAGCTAAVQPPSNGFSSTRDVPPPGTLTDAPKISSSPIKSAPPSITSEQAVTPSAVPSSGVPTARKNTNVEAPEAIERVAPVYPEEAKRAGIEGEVIVQCFVGANGAVGETRIEKSIPALDAAAIAAVKQWRFKPALSADGKPAAVWVAIPIQVGP